MRASVKAVMSIFGTDRETARRIYGLMQHKVEPNTRWVNVEYEPVDTFSKPEYALLEIGLLLGGNGVLYINHADDTRDTFHGYSYIDFDDIGKPTVVYNHLRNQFSIASPNEVIGYNSKLGANHD